MTTDTQIVAARKAYRDCLAQPRLVALREDVQYAYDQAQREARNRSRSLRFLNADIVGTYWQQNYELALAQYERGRALVLETIPDLIPLVGQATTTERRRRLTALLFPPAEWGHRRFAGQEEARLHYWRTHDDQGRPASEVWVRQTLPRLLAEWEALSCPMM